MKLTYRSATIYVNNNVNESKTQLANNPNPWV